MPRSPDESDVAPAGDMGRYGRVKWQFDSGQQTGGGGGVCLAVVSGQARSAVPTFGG